MSIYGELRKSALQIIKAQKTQDIPIGVLFDKFEALATPVAVLALIAEVEGLRAQHGRDSAELRSLCQARDDARKDRDQLKAENETLRIGMKGDYDLDAWLDWAKEKWLLKAEVERLTADNTSLRGSCAKLGAEHAGMVRQIKKLKVAKP